MKYLNVRDEQRRLTSLKVYLSKESRQDFTDGYSYLGAREILKINNITMGFDVSDHAFKKYQQRCLERRLREN